MIKKSIVINTSYWYEELGREQENYEISDLTIVSRDEKLNPLSYFYNDKWNLKSYSKTSNNSIINFSRIDKQHIKDAKIIMYMVLMYGKSRFGRQLEAKTIISHYYNSSVVPVSKWITEHNLTFSSFFKNSENSFQFSKEKASSNIQSLLPFFNIMSNITNRHFPFKVDISKKTIRLLREIRTIKEESKKQTPIIPTRILSNSLNARWQHINFIKNHTEGICDFIQRYMRTKAYYGKTTSLFLEAVNKSKIGELVDKYEINNKVSFSSFLVKLQGTCKNLIHAYSGMRHKEAYFLTVNSFESNKNKSILNGYTTKLEGSKKSVSWVTSNEIEVVFEILKKINATLTCDLTVNKEKLPLFTTTLLISNSHYNKNIIPSLALNNELYIDSALITINEKDLKELEAVDPFREWQQEENFSVGSKWHFASHQYRRSLAVYSMQSGLVNIGALKMQLKHLFQEMTLYYTKGGSHSSDMLYEQELVRDFKKTSSNVQSLEYIKDVIFSGDELFGIHGSYVEKNKKYTSLNLKEYILQDRDKTLKMFQNGDIAYKETAIGGCISTEPCDSYLTNSLVACAGCDSAIIKKDKLENIIFKQSEFIRKLNPNSVEYRTEKSELDALVKQKNRIS